MTHFHSAFNEKLAFRTFQRTPHYLIPGLNQQKKLCTEHCSEHGGQFPVHCADHKLLIPKREMQHEGEQDAATNLVSEKLRWQEKVNALAKRYRRSPKDRTTLELLHGKVLAGETDITVPDPLAQFVNHIARDPDPDFCGSYNWYYCEGTLSVVNLKKKAFIISTQGRYLDKICSVPLEEGSDGWEPCHSATITKHGPIRRKPIYQIKTKEVTGRAVVGVRQRNAVAIYLNQLKRLSLNLVSVHTSEICENEKPFSGLDLDYLKPGHFCNCQSDRTVQVWDPTYKTPILQGNAQRNIKCSKENSSSWCGVWYDKDDINQIIVADNCCVTWHDVRCGLTKSNGICLRTSQHRLPLQMSCEELSLVIPSQQHHQLYLGTTHSLLQIDKRKPSVMPKPVRRWTHMLSGQLLMGQTVPVHGTNSELICISCNQQAVMFLGGEVCCSQHQPLALPYTSVKQGIVGLSFLPHPCLKRYDLITQMGSGDVYRHRLKWDYTKGESPSTSDAECHRSPDSYRPLATGRHLNVTGRLDMQPVYLDLQSASKMPLKREFEPSIQRQQWQRSKAELLSYVDILAPGILDVWGIDEMQEWSTSSIVPSAVDKVQQWLQMNSTLVTPVDKNTATSPERISTDRQQDTELMCLSDNVPLTPHTAETETQHVISRSGPARNQHVSNVFSRSLEVTEPVLPVYDTSENWLNTHGDTSFQLTPDTTTPSRHLKSSNLKRKSQVLGF